MSEKRFCKDNNLVHFSLHYYILYKLCYFFILALIFLYIYIIMIFGRTLLNKQINII